MRRGRGAINRLGNERRDLFHNGGQEGPRGHSHNQVRGGGDVHELFGASPLVTRTRREIRSKREKTRGDIKSQTKKKGNDTASEKRLFAWKVIIGGLGGAWKLELKTKGAGWEGPVEGEFEFKPNGGVN